MAVFAVRGSLLRCVLSISFLTILNISAVRAQDLLISGVIDGPLPGGIPKAVELFAVNNIADLSIYGVGSANNGGGSDGEEFTFPAGGVAAGTFIYVASEAVGFEAFFGFEPDYTDSALAINGDDAMELFANGVVIDVFGDINTDGTGQPWDHLDGWAYRVDGTGPDGSIFILSNWTFSGINALDGESSNATAATPFPLASYIGGGGPVENAPLVVSTTPADGATGVTADANISITFSEDVTVTGNWYEADCSISGLISAVQSGGPQSFTLNPDFDFMAGEDCAVTVFAANVSDNDLLDPPDNPDSDTVFAFTVASAPMADSIIINEIMQNPSAVSDGNGEWFELFNSTADSIDINGWTVQDNDSDSFVIAAGGPLEIPPGGLVVLSNNGDSASNGGVNVAYEYSGMFLSNGSDELVLLDGALAEVDRVEWDNGNTFPDPTGASMALIDPALDNNVGFNWCTAGSTFGDGDAGTPGQVNDCGFKPVVNEIDYDQPGRDTAEFVEIFNRGSEAGDLSQVTLELINGNGGSSYASIALPPVDLGPGEYFVVCADATTVAVCDLEAINSIQNGSPDAVALTIAGLVVDTVSYEGDTAAPYTEGSGEGLSDSGSSGQDFLGISRLPDGFDSNQNNLDLARSCITPGGANTALDTGCTVNGPVLEIFDIQGNGLASAFAGQTLGTQGNVVTAVGTDGFAMQTPTARSDGDVDTSDGIYVFTGGAPAVAVGDIVDVRGQVVEFFGFTEFSFGSIVTVTGSGAVPSAVVLDATTPSPDPTNSSCAIEYECYEGMLVSIAEGSVTGPNQRFGTDPVAEVHISAAPLRSYREPGIEFPGIAGLPVWDGNPEVFELDPNKLGLPNQIIPAGSSFSAVGIIGYEFGGYELWPSELTVNAAPLPLAVPARGPAEISVGSLNLFRLFDDVDDGTENVVSSAEYLRRLDKFSQYVRGVLDSPDVLAVQEVEKLGVLDDLAMLIASDDPAVVYSAYLVEGNDVGGIDVGFLVRDTMTVDAVTQLGADEILAFDGSLLNDRPPLLLEARATADGSQFPLSVMVVHNRSLGGIDDASSGPRVRAKRLAQSQSIAQKVQDLQTADPDINLIVIGDFNAFEFSDGYVDAIGQIKGQIDPAANLLSGPDLVDPNLINQVEMLPAAERYSFIFRGTAQALDHALTSTGLDNLVRDVAFGRGNADAAVDLINDASTPLRSSDHDGMVVLIVKDSDGDSITDDVDQCAATVIPEGVPTVRLGTNRYALVDDDTQFDTSSQGNNIKDQFSLTDTAGCSCEQIIAAQGLGNGHRKFGCSVGAMRNWVDQVNAGD